MSTCFFCVGFRQVYLATNVHNVHDVFFLIILNVHDKKWKT